MSSTSDVISIFDQLALFGRYVVTSDNQIVCVGFGIVLIQIQLEEGVMEALDVSGTKSRSSRPMSS